MSSQACTKMAWQLCLQQACLPATLALPPARALNPKAAQGFRQQLESHRAFTPLE